MKKILILLIFLLAQCGYQPLYSSKNQKDLTFKEINYLGNNNINRRIISAIGINQDKQGLSGEKITLESKKSIIETSKNSKGQTESFKMILEVKLEIKDNQNIKKEKIFVKEFPYKNLENKFDLSEYEKNIENDLIDQIIEELVIYLNV